MNLYFFFQVHIDRWPLYLWRLPQFVPISKMVSQRFIGSFITVYRVSKKTRLANVQTIVLRTSLLEAINLSPREDTAINLFANWYEMQIQRLFSLHLWNIDVVLQRSRMIKLERFIISYHINVFYQNSSLTKYIFITKVY